MLLVPREVQSSLDSIILPSPTINYLSQIYFMILSQTQQIYARDLERFFDRLNNFRWKLNYTLHVINTLDFIAEECMGGITKIFYFQDPIFRKSLKFQILRRVI